MNQETIQKWLFSLISVPGENSNSRNISQMPAVKIFARLELNGNLSFLDGHRLEQTGTNQWTEQLWSL